MVHDPSSTWITFVNSFFAFIYINTLAQIIAHFSWIFIILETIKTFTIIGAHCIDTFVIQARAYNIHTFVDIQTFTSIATISFNFYGFLSVFKLLVKLNHNASVLKFFVVKHKVKIHLKICNLNKTSWANAFIGANSIWAFIWIITKPFSWLWVALININALLIFGISKKSIHTSTLIRTLKIIVKK